MTHYIILCIISLIFFTYVYYVYRKFGILDSISDSYYYFMDWRRDLFTAFAWGLSAGMIALSVNADIEYGKYPWGFFVSGACLAFLGAAPKFKVKPTATIHVIGATGGILTALLEMIRYYQDPLPVIVFLLCFALLKYFWIKKRGTLVDIYGEIHYVSSGLGEVENFTWWIEIVAFICILIGFILK